MIPYEQWDAHHIKTGETYRVVGEATNCTNEQNGQLMVIYQKDGHLFVRSAEEFMQKFTAHLFPL